MSKNELTKMLYERMVQGLYNEWSTLYPMADWVDPERSIHIIAAELRELRKKIVAQ